VTDRLPDAQEVAEWLNVPIAWVRESTRSGALPCVELGRYRRYERAAIEEWLKSEARRSRWHSRRVKVGSGGADQPSPDAGSPHVNVVLLAGGSASPSRQGATAERSGSSVPILPVEPGQSGNLRCLAAGRPGGDPARAGYPACSLTPTSSPIRASQATRRRSQPSSPSAARGKGALTPGEGTAPGVGKSVAPPLALPS
jgi:excisionase family DNA binding protein